MRDDRPEPVRRKAHVARKLNDWVTTESARAVRWQLLRPVSAASDVPTLKILDDGSILASGDQTKRDVYRLTLANELPVVTALRIEALPDDSLPKRGPGRIAYEGPFGDFFLSEITARATGSGDALAFASASQSLAAGKDTAERAIDRDPQTGWSINPGQGEAHTAVFALSRRWPRPARWMWNCCSRNTTPPGWGDFASGRLTSSGRSRRMDCPPT